MPKISNNNINIENSDIKKAFNIEVYYNQDHGFFHPLSAEFTETCKHINDDKKKELFMCNKRKSKHSVDKEVFIVEGATESDCISNAKKAILFLIESHVEKRNVIILFYLPDDTRSYNNHLYNNEHPQIGIKLGLTYAVETKLGDKKVYNQYRVSKWSNDRERTDRLELNLWNAAATIIPDTPENRETLESLYFAFKTLRQKLCDITKSEENILQFIASKQKLLSYD